MKNKSALQLIFLVFITGCSTNVIDENDLVEKSSLAYLKNSETPFSGKINGKFKNGNNRIIGQFDEGKKVGNWFLFYDNGNEKEKGTYSNGNKIGTWISYYKDGVISSKGDYIKGEKESLWKYWYNSGVKEKEVQFLEGKKNGKVVLSHTNEEEKSDANQRLS